MRFPWLLVLVGCGVGEVERAPVVVRVAEPEQVNEGALVVLHDSDGRVLEWSHPGLGAVVFEDPPYRGAITAIRDGQAFTTTIVPGDVIDLVPRVQPTAPRNVTITYPAVADAAYLVEGPDCFLSTTQGSLAGTCGDPDTVIVKAVSPSAGELGYAVVPLAPDVPGAPVYRGAVDEWRTDFVDMRMALQPAWPDAETVSLISSYVGDRRYFTRGTNDGRGWITAIPQFGERFVVDLQASTGTHAARLVESREVMPEQIVLDLEKAIALHADTLEHLDTGLGVVWGGDAEDADAVLACASFASGVHRWCVMREATARAIPFPELPLEIQPSNPIELGVTAVESSLASYDDMRRRPLLAYLGLEVPPGTRYRSSQVGLGIGIVP